MEMCSCFEGVENPKFEYTYCGAIRDFSAIKVYKIKDDNETKYAWKIIPEGPDTERILREFKILSNLNHENILKVFDYTILTSCNNGICNLPIRLCAKDGEKYKNSIAIRFEYCDGLDLATRIKESNLSLDEKWNIAEIITDTLSFLHSENIIHRDVKPGNIFFKNNKPILGDFGESKWCEEADLTQKQTNEYIGTYLYVAPEVQHRNRQSSSREYGSRADGFSWGMTLAHLFYPKSASNGLTYEQWNAKFRTVYKSGKSSWEMLAELEIPTDIIDMKLYIWVLTLYDSKERYHIRDIHPAFTQDECKQKIQTYKKLYLDAYTHESGFRISKSNLQDVFEILKEVEAKKELKTIEGHLAAVGRCVTSSNSSFLNKVASIQELARSAEYNTDPKLFHLMTRFVQTAKLHGQYWAIQSTIGKSYLDKMLGQSRNANSEREKVSKEFESCKVDTTEFSAGFQELVQTVIDKWIINIESSELIKLVSAQGVLQVVQPQQPVQGARAEEDPNPVICVICNDNRMNRVFLCGHPICSSCLERIIPNENGDVLCHMCRAPITATNPLFL